MTGPHEMRRADREITDPARIDDLLKRGRFITLALVDGVEPYVVTLSYGYDSQSRRMYFHVAHAGHKLDVIAVNPRACGTVVLDGGYNQGECEHPFESVVVRGTLRIAEDPAEKRNAIRALVGHLEPDAETYWASRTWDLEDRLGGFKALMLDIESVSAKEGK